MKRVATINQCARGRSGSPPGRIDDSKIEVVVDGLPLFHGLAVDATPLSPVRVDEGTHRRVQTTTEQLGNSTTKEGNDLPGPPTRQGALGGVGMRSERDVRTGVSGLLGLPRV